MTATHPTDRELGEFLLGKLDGPDESGLEGHLSECDPCRDRAAGVAADDTFTELLAAARTRFDSQRASDATPTLDGAATPPAFAATLAWDGPAGVAPGADATSPGAYATGLAAADVPFVLAQHPKYRVVRRLGIGGMGTVWLAEHTVMNRPVAVKVIRPDLLARPGATGRFLREVRAAAKLHHPNIVTAFDAEPAGDSCLLVMEYVSGETLGERLEAGPLPVAEACRAAQDAARGLAHAHAHGLIHRDVKPHNLIRTASPDASAPGVTKVLDFGLAGVGAGEVVAADGDGLTGAGMVVGTPHYIAPEQVTDPHAADARADIYGLGCTLYHLLAGHPPFPDGSIAETLAAQQTREPEPIPGLPASLAAVLAKMTAKRPEDRYQTADEVATEMDGFVRAGSVSDGKAATVADASGSVRWRRWLAVAAGILLITAAGVVIKIKRDNQEITITTDDPDIEVVMKRKGEVVRVIDKKSGQQWDIDATKNEIAQADSPVGLTVKLPETEPFVLKRNGKEVFTVRRLPAAAAPTDRGDGFVPLFNGKDLTGWKSADPATWTWAGNVLTAKGAKGIIITERADYANFHLRLSIKCAIDSGASIRFRTGDALYADRYLTGIHPAQTAKILIGGGVTVTRNQKQTGLATNGEVGPPDQWHTLEVIAVGNRIRTIVNGKSIADVTDPDNTRTRGTFALLLWGQRPQEVQFKDVEIKELPLDAAQPPKPDHELIQGTWRAISGERDGDIKFTASELKQITMTFAGETATVTQPGPGGFPDANATHRGTFTLDQTKNPKHITVTGGTEVNFRGNFGIYELEGDTLKICMSDAKMGRPTEFKSKIGDKLFVNIELKRETAAKAKVDAATKAAEAWLKLLDDEKYAEAWEQLFSVGKLFLSRDNFVRICQQRAKDSGALISRTLHQAELLPVDYVVIQFASKYTFIDPVFEKVVLAQDADGKWRATTFGVTPRQTDEQAQPIKPAKKP